MDVVNSRMHMLPNYFQIIETKSDVYAEIENRAHTKKTVGIAFCRFLYCVKEEICPSQDREEYRAGASGGNPPPATIHTWLERFNKQKPHSFEKAVAPVDAENWISHMEKIFDAKGGDAWVLYLDWAAFLRDVLSSVFSLERARAFLIEFTDVAQVADAARNLEILRDRDDYDRSERSDKRHKSGDRYHPYSQQGSHKSHGQSDDRQRSDRQGSDRQSGGSNYRNNNNNNHSRDNNRSNLNRYRLYLLYDMNLTSRHGNRNSGAGRDQRNRGSQQSRVPSEGYTHPVCNTCGRRHPGECRRAAGTCFKCGQAGHLQRDCKKNIGASSSGHVDLIIGSRWHQPPRSPSLGDIESHSLSHSTTLTNVVVSYSAPSDRECVVNSYDQ
ncbi:zinc finger, CCHC-type, retrotransposon gag domain protein [Tanacetum coccineum]